MKGAVNPAGFDPVVLARAPTIVRSVIDSGDLSGAVTLVWRGGEIAQISAMGMADIARSRPMTRDTLFRIASMTKPVTSVLALMLWRAGAFSLDDPISRWAPEFSDMRVLRDPAGPLDDTYPAARPITIEDLLTHRAGLAYGFTSLGPIARAHEAALGDVLATDMDPDGWMAAIASLPLSFPPGERFHYGHATDVLGFLMQRIAGRPFRDLLIERIFRPLGMVDTDFYIPAEKRERAATVYRFDQASESLAPLRFAKLDAPPRFCGGGGGLISTADDYLTFARVLLGGGAVDGVRLLDAEAVGMMRTNRLTEAQRAIDFLGIPFWQGQGFGLGLSMITDPKKQSWMGAGSAGAFGWPGAFGTWWQADPAQEMILLYLVQNSTPLGPDAAAQLATGQRMGARVALPMWQKQVYGALEVGWAPSA
ncbi:MAG: serine hydrolase domain-containing protein [Caulobacteraceae bacterium]